MLALLKSQGLAGFKRRTLLLVLSYMACQVSTTKTLVCDIDKCVGLKVLLAKRCLTNNTGLHQVPTLAMWQRLKVCFTKKECYISSIEACITYLNVADCDCRTFKDT